MPKPSRSFFPKQLMTRNSGLWLGAFCAVIILVTGLVLGRGGKPSSSSLTCPVPSCPKRFGPSAFASMQRLSFLVGRWKASVVRFDSLKKLPVSVESDLIFEFKPWAGSKILLLTISGTYEGQLYEGAGAVYYDLDTQEYRKIWGDNILGSTMALSGDFVNAEADTAELPDELQQMRLTSRDTCIVELMYRYGPDSVALVELDGRDGDRELSRFSLVTAK